MAFGEPTMNRTQVQLLYKRFKEGREYFKNDVRPGRPSTSTTDENMEAVKKMILDKRRIIIRESNFGSCEAIFTAVFGMNHAACEDCSKMY